jgi:hypothetical protein
MTVKLVVIYPLPISPAPHAQRIKHRTAEHMTNRMKLVLKRSNDAKVSAATANTPEQIGILARAGNDQFAVCRYHVS